jgi:hypothetical protein
MTDHSERHAQAWVAEIDRDIIGDCPSAVWWPPGVLGPGAKKVQFASGPLFIVARR